MLADLDRGDFVAPNKITLATFLNSKWLPEVETRVRPTTLESYRLHVKTYIAPRLGQARLQALRPDHLNTLYRDLRKAGSRTSGPLSARTVELTHTTIRCALKDAVRWGYLARNIADAANRPRNTHTPEMKTWAADQLATFLAHVEQHDEHRYPLWRLLATTGLRRGEALGARWQDLDLDNARLAVRQTLLARGKNLIYGTPKTNRSRRSVALDTVTVNSLRRHRTAQAADKLATGEAYHTGDLVFADAVGGPLHPDAVSKAFKDHQRAAGLPNLNLHGLRHTHATLALQSGVHAKVVSERLGHSSVALTLDVYSHVVPAMQHDAADQIAALIDGTGPR